MELLSFSLLDRGTEAETSNHTPEGTQLPAQARFLAATYVTLVILTAESRKTLPLPSLQVRRQSPDPG